MSPALGEKPILVLTFFAMPHARVLVDAVAASAIPPEVTVYLGSYGIRRDVGEIVRELPNGRYAPILAIQPSGSPRAYAGRQGTALEQEALLGPRYRGPVPRADAALPLPSEDHFGWGIELGRRLRDNLEDARASMPVDAWQFDEVLGETVRGSRQNEYADYVSGVLYGVRVGRPKLGHRPEKGIVWVGKHATQALPGAALTPARLRLWKQLNLAASHFVGEEYPPFTIEPSGAARRFRDGQSRLAAGSQSPIRSLGRRYVAGLTPGYTITPARGGRGPDQPREEVPIFRRAFLQARMLTPPIGFGQFAFVDENVAVGAVREVLDALVGPLQQLLS